MSTQPLRHLLGRSVEIGTYETMCGEIVTDNTVIADCSGTARVTCKRCINRRREYSEYLYDTSQEW